MEIEKLVTRLEINSDGELYVGFRNLGGIFHPDWKHVFVTEILGRRSDDPLEQEEALQAIKSLKAKLAAIPEIAGYKQRYKNKYWYVWQLFCPINLKDLLPDEFIRGHYTQQARRLIRPGDMLFLDDILVDALKSRKALQQELNDLKKEIGQNRKPGYATKTFNDLDEFFDKYTGSNMPELKFPEHSTLHNLETIISKRKDIADRIMEINRKLDGKARLVYRKKHNSRSHALRLEKESFDYLQEGRSILPSELLSKKWLFIDIEVPHYKEEDAQITWIAFTYYHNGEKRPEIHTIHDTGIKEVKGFTIYRHKDENELLKAAAESVNTHNPDVVTSYTSYDLVKLKESAAGFPIGEDDTQPLYRSTAKFFERMGIKDRLVVDFLRWQQKARAYDPNAKLAMAAGFEKSESYKELELLEDKAFAGDTEAARRIAEYLAGDVDALVSLFMLDDFRKNLADLCWISETYEVAIERLFHSTNSINDAQELEYLKGLGIYRQHVDPHQPYKQTQQRETSARQYFIEHVVEKLIKTDEAKGLSHDVFLVYVPYAEFFKHMIAVRFPDAMHLFNHKEKFRDDKQRLFFLEQYAKEFARWIITDYGQHLKEVDELDSMLKQERLLAREKIDLKEFEDAYHSFREALEQRSKYYLKQLNEARLSQKGMETGMTPEIRDFMRKYGLDRKSITGMANQRSKIKRTGRNIWGNYAIFPDRRFFVPEKHVKTPLVIEDILEEKFREVNEYLEKNNLRAVAQEGAYLYVVGDKSILQKEDCPLVLADEIKTLYNADKPYYEKHGFINDLVLSDEPTYNMNVFEMSNFGKMMCLLFEGENDKAIAFYERAYEDLRKGKVNLDDLLFHNKSKERFHAFVNGDKVYFVEQERFADQKKIEEDETGRYFTDEERDKKIKVYIGMPVFKPDLDQYLEKFREKAEAILEPVMRRVEQVELFA